MIEIDAKIARLRADTMRISEQSGWFPFVMVAVVYGAAILLVKLQVL